MSVEIVAMLASFHVMTFHALLHLNWLVIDARRMVAVLADRAEGRKPFRDVAGILNASGKRHGKPSISTGPLY